jgi:hypothetical protein
MLPLLGMCITPLKRVAFRFRHLFWILDREVFCSEGLVGSCLSISAALQTAERQPLWDNDIEGIIGELYKHEATLADVDYLRRVVNLRLDALSSQLVDIANKAEADPSSLKQSSPDDDSLPASPSTRRLAATTPDGIRMATIRRSEEDPSSSSSGGEDIVSDGAEEL